MCRLKFKQREREREIDFESFLRAKKTLVCFLLFACARARKQMYMCTLERERAENENQKELRTSERLRERALPRCRDLALSLEKVVDV